MQHQWNDDDIRFFYDNPFWAVKDISKGLLLDALQSPNLGGFLQRTAETLVSQTGAKRCMIYLVSDFLDQKTNPKGSHMTAVAVFGEDSEYFRNQPARYYIPDRKPMSDDCMGKGKERLSAFLDKYFQQKLKDRWNDLVGPAEDNADTSSTLAFIFSVGDRIAEWLDEKGNLSKQAIQSGQLPMGITVSCLLEGKATLLTDRAQIEAHPEWRGSYDEPSSLPERIYCLPIMGPQVVHVGAIRLEDFPEAPPGGEPQPNRGVSESNHEADGKIWKALEWTIEIAGASIALTFANMARQSNEFCDKFGDVLVKKIANAEWGLASSANSRVKKEIDKFGMNFYAGLHSPLVNSDPDLTGGVDLSRSVSYTINRIVEELDLHCVREITDNVGQAFESLLGTDVGYRDHFFHQFQVFMLGYYMINENNSLAEKLLLHLKQKHPDPSLDDVVRGWFLCSMFHDFAYSVSKIDKWMAEYEKRIGMKLNANVDWDSMFPNYEDVVDKLVDPISKATKDDRFRIKAILEKGFREDRDHGILSAITMMTRLSKKAIKCGGDSSKILLDEACQAIMLHNDGIYTQLCNLCVDELPFSFLLIFCDAVQQWGRPSLWKDHEDLTVSLRDIQARDKKPISVELHYERLTNEAERIVKKNTSLPRRNWLPSTDVGFQIVLLRGKFFREFDRFEIISK